MKLSGQFQKLVQTESKRTCLRLALVATLVTGTSTFGIAQITGGTGIGTTGTGTTGTRTTGTTGAFTTGTCD